MSIYDYLQENMASLGQRAYLSPEIPENKINNAIVSFKEDIDPNHVIALFDSTIFGNGKDGCLFLGEALYLKAAFGKTRTIYYEDLTDISLEETTNEKGKVISNIYLSLSSQQNRINITDDLLNVPFEDFVCLVEGIIELGESNEQFKNTNQVTPLEQLDELTKITYTKIVINFIFDINNDITARQYVEIMSLTTRIEMSKESRREIRDYLNKQTSKIETLQLLKDLKNQLTESGYKVVGGSIIKDILHAFKINNSIHDWKENKFIRKVTGHFDFEDKKVNLLVEAIIHDEDILKNRKTDSEIKKSMKEIVTKAGAVGVPVAALYFSGSVIGLGATGITSGLATLGLGGILGLSGMATGIGAIVLLGIGTYQGLKKVTGISEVTNSKQRELMLQGIINNTQKTLNFLIEDINEITSDLVSEISKTNKNSEKINKLSTMLSLLSQGAQVNSVNQEESQKEEIITRLPKELNVGRLEELTDKPMLEPYREFVKSIYEENDKAIISEDNDEEQKLKKVWVLGETQTLPQLEHLEKIFETIGYNELSNAALASTKQSVKKITGFLKG